MYKIAKVLQQGTDRAKPQLNNQYKPSCIRFIQDICIVVCATHFAGCKTFAIPSCFQLDIKCLIKCTRTRYMAWKTHPVQTSLIYELVEHAWHAKNLLFNIPYSSYITSRNPWLQMHTSCAILGRLRSCFTVEYKLQLESSACIWSHTTHCRKCFTTTGFQELNSKERDI